MIDVVSSLNKLLEQPKLLFARSQLESNSSTDLLSNLDTLAENIDRVLRNSRDSAISSIESNFQQGAPNVAFAINRTIVSGDLFLVCRKFGNNLHNSIITDERQVQVTSDTLSIIKLPKEIFTYSEESLYSYCFKQSSLFLNEKEIYGYKNKDNEADIFSPVDSVVSSATVGFRNIKNLTYSIIVIFKRFSASNATMVHNCYYWNPQARKYMNLLAMFKLRLNVTRKTCRKNLL